MTFSRSAARRGSIAILLAWFVSSSGEALANGYELMPAGNQSVARGGAVAARPEDPTLLLNDPAGLALLPDNRLLVDLNTAIHHMCVDPYGYYGWGVYGAGTSEFGDQLELDDPVAPTVGATYASSPMPEVCNSAAPRPLPQIALSGKLSPDLAIAGGLVAPVGVTGLQYGGDDGTMETPQGTRPTPTRYAIVQQKVVFALNPTVGVAYRFIPEISAGVTAQVLMVHARAKAVQNFVAGTQPSSDWLATIETEDYFIPSLTFSLHTKPVRPVDMVLAFKWTDDFHGSGSVTYETNTFHRGDPTGPIPFENEPQKIDDIQVGLPWQLTGGIRYGHPLPGGGGRAGDPMETELWDVEVDVSAQLNALARSSVRVGNDVTVETRTATGGGERITVQDLAALDLDRHQKTVYAARLGGSYSVVPREVAVHAGGFYETRGVRPEYADIDTFAFERVGVGAGVVLRLGSIDVRAGYAHIFSETLEVAPPPHTDSIRGFDQRVGGSFATGDRVGGVELRDPDAPSPSKADAVARKTQTAAVSTTERPERVTNAGRYSARFDIVSVGLMYRF